MKIYSMIGRFFIIITAIFVGSCKEAFEPELKSTNTNNLVVEGIINTGAGQTKITLSRVTSLDKKVSTLPELGAKVQVESADNMVQLLPEQGNGIYAAVLNGAATGKQYRLRITTSSNKVYLSDYTESLLSPPIESVNWKRQANGVQIVVNANGIQNPSRYYKWEYDEIYEYRSYIASIYKYLPVEDQVVITPENERKHICWQSGASNDILLGSTAALSQNVISQSPIRFIPNGAVQLSTRYYLSLKQYALSADAYKFLMQMKKNTELTGSVFDPQPSEVAGNIHCISNPGEVVIGYVSAASVEEKAIFINNSELPNWSYVAGVGCAASSRTVSNTATERKNYLARGYYPVAPIYDNSGSIIVAWTSLFNECVDCTLQGGTIAKPSFW